MPRSHCPPTPLRPPAPSGVFVAATEQKAHGTRRDPHPRRPRAAQGGTERASDHAPPRGGRAHQGRARVRGHLGELRVRRRKERADDARAAHRPARGAAALGPGRRPEGHLHRVGPGRLRRLGQGREDRQVAEVHDRRLGRGEPEGEQALQRVAGRPRAARPQAQRRRLRAGPARPRAQAQDHQDRRRPVTSRAMAADELLATRREKLERLRAHGVEPFPHAYPGVAPVATVHAAHASLPAGEDSDRRYRGRGRIHARRCQGKMAILDLDDRSGRIQLQAKADVLGPERMSQLLDLDLGDLIGVDGLAFRSRRGELSLRVEDFAVLAKSLRPPPEKFHGLKDTETRFRHRELDLIANEDARALFVTRAKAITAVRRYLDEAGFVEVETPVLQPIYGGAIAQPFTTHHNELDRTLYLRIATELYLKRLIVGGLERVYELGKDFRNEGVSFKHNPEFTMVEWYEAYADYADEMRRVEEMVAFVARECGYAGELDLEPPWPRVTLRDAILDKCGIDILAHRDRDALVVAIRDSERTRDVPTDDRTWPQLVDDLLSKFVEPEITRPQFIIDYPVELSPFAKAHRSEPGLVERFEAFVGGMEIANAFSELNDPDEQRARFEAQVRHAQAGDEEAQPMDEGFLAALEQGMPPTGGVGVGIDRLVMVMTGQRSSREVVLFPAMRD